MLTYKYRLKLKKSQISKLKEQLEICRILYNNGLAERRDAWKNEKRSISYFDQNSQLKHLKKTNIDLLKVYSQCLQEVYIKLDLAFKAFFRRCKRGENPGYPRFKSKNRYTSIVYSQYKESIKIRKNGKLYIPKIGEVGVFGKYILKGIPKTAIVSLINNKVFICITCDDILAEIKNNHDTIGIDVGINNFATLSNGIIVENPRFFEQSQKKLAREQRRNAKKPSIKLKYRIAKIHEKIRNRRENFAHQLSRKLVNTYGTIIIEDLQINKMLEKHWCSKQIADAAWNSFFNKLLYKAENAGITIIKVDPSYTSQDCSRCNTRVLKNLDQRVHKCPNCNLEMDRDLNAAKNILARGLTSLAKEA